MIELYDSNGRLLSVPGGWYFEGSEPALCRRNQAIPLPRDLILSGRRLSPDEMDQVAAALAEAEAPIQRAIGSESESGGLQTRRAL